MSIYRIRTVDDGKAHGTKTVPWLPFREKQVKGWVRNRKILLIESANRDWKDLSDGWYGK
jgi:hypothetical protein